MKNSIDKSNKILNTELQKWLPILEMCGFPDEHYNLGAEYCEFHTKIEKYNTSLPLLPLSLYILKSINLDDLNDYYLIDGLYPHSLSIMIDDYEIDTMIHGGEITYTTLSRIEHIIRDESILMLNKMIEKSEHKIAEFGTLISNIIIVTENKKSVIHIKSNINIR